MKKAHLRRSEKQHTFFPLLKSNLFVTPRNEKMFTSRLMSVYTQKYNNNIFIGIYIYGTLNFRLSFLIENEDSRNNGRGDILERDKWVVGGC